MRCRVANWLTPCGCTCPIRSLTAKGIPTAGGEVVLRTAARSKGQPIQSPGNPISFTYRTKSAVALSPSFSAKRARYVATVLGLMSSCSEMA